MRAGDVVASRFEIEELAGEGGMGTVYRARDRFEGRRVALKVVQRSGVTDDERFAREARALAELHHPGIVRYVAHGFDAAGVGYLATEWLEGEPLSARIEREGLSVAEAVQVAAQVAAALAVAHARGVAHRDIKPSNIFLPGGQLGAVKLLDFGLAHLGRGMRAVTRSGVIVGTPGYMSPEQARTEKNVDPRADVFSLGCVLFECLTGRPAFESDQLMAILAKILFAEVPRPRELNPEVPPALDELVGRMLAKDPADRPADGAAVCEALEAIVAAGLDESGRRSAPPRTEAITSYEQRLLSVVLVPDFAAPPLDPERTLSGEPAAGALEPVRAALAAYGARVERLADGALVAFMTSSGPGAATDQAAVAARCALKLREHLPTATLALATGRGILSGHTPLGEVIDRAAALTREPSSEPGQIRVDDVTARLLDGRFEVRAEAGARYSLRAEHEVAETGRKVLGRATPCVGRERELRALHDLWRECVEEPVARAVIVSGPAGIGKSRLAQELMRELQQGEQPPSLWLARGDPMTAGSPLGMLGQLVGSALGLRRRETLAARHAVLREQAADSTQAVFLGELVGAPFPDEESVQLRTARRDPQVMGDQLRLAWLGLLQARCARRPVLVVLEDLQWGDAPTIGFVDAALRTLRDSPFLVLALARPETRRLFPDLWSERRVDEVRPAELSRRACEKLAREVLGERANDALVARLAERAAGVPLVLEELLWAVAEGRGEELPETVAAMVQARLDGLEPTLRRVLRAASVFGATFWSGGVQSLLGGAGETGVAESLLALVERELIDPRPVARFPGEHEFAFRHSLVQQTVYESFTAPDRALGHRMAGEWLQAAGETDALLLAEHLERGGVPERAVTWFRRAAEQALAGNDLTRALECAGMAISCGARGAEKGALHLLEAEAQRWRGEPALAGRRAHLAAELLPRASAGWFRAIDEVATSLAQRGEYAEAARRALDASSEQAPADAVGAQIVCLCSVARALLPAGRYEDAHALRERIRVRAAEVGELDLIATAQIHRLDGARARHVGDVAGDAAGYRLALLAFERAGDARNACNMRVSVGFAAIELGDFETAERELTSALATAERMGVATLAMRARQNLGLVEARRGAHDEARVRLEHVVAQCRKQGNVRFEGGTLIYLANLLCDLGDATSAEWEAALAADLLQNVPPAQAGALAALSRARRLGGRVPEALQAAETGQKILEGCGGIEEFEGQVRLAWIEALHAAGRIDEARAALARARERLTERAGRIDEPGARATFLEAVPENRRTLELARAWLDD